MPKVWTPKHGPRDSLQVQLARAEARHPCGENGPGGGTPDHHKREGRRAGTDAKVGGARPGLKLRFKGSTSMPCMQKQISHLARPDGSPGRSRRAMDENLSPSRFTKGPSPCKKVAEAPRLSATAGGVLHRTALGAERATSNDSR